MSKIPSIRDVLTNGNTPKCRDKCSQCEKETSSMCQRCLLVPYCSKECQQSDWKIHKVVCLEVKEARQVYDMMLKKVNTNVDHFWSLPSGEELHHAWYRLVLAVKDCSLMSNYLPGIQLALDIMLEQIKIVEGDSKEMIKYSIPSLLLAQDKPDKAYSYIKFIMGQSQKKAVDWSKFLFEHLPIDKVEEPLGLVDVHDMKLQTVIDVCLAKIKVGKELDKQVIEMLDVIGRLKPEMLSSLADRSDKIPNVEDKEVAAVLMNSYRLWRKDDRCREFLFSLEKKTSWAVGLPPAKAYEWLVDCYRMRLDDDYVYSGDLRGLYACNDDANDLVMEFLAFCKLAKAKNVLPTYWNWSSFLSEAAKLLRCAFEKSDAQEKYGGENVFSVAMGGRSLRYTAEQVYGSGVMEGTGEDNELMMNKLRRGINKNNTEDVGGEKIWKSLVRNIASQFWS